MRDDRFHAIEEKNSSWTTCNPRRPKICRNPEKIRVMPTQVNIKRP